MIYDECESLRASAKQQKSRRRSQAAIKGLGRAATLAEAAARLESSSILQDGIGDEELQEWIVAEMSA